MSEAINNVEFYTYQGVKGGEDFGYVVDPESETKTVFIPSPPTKMVQKTNPRKVAIYITGGKVDENYVKLDELKAYCKDNKIVFICPKATEEEELGETYKYIFNNARTLNIKLDEISVKGDEVNLEVAQKFVDYAVDELDADLDDAEAFEL